MRANPHGLSAWFVNSAQQAGAEADNQSEHTWISADGRHVAFYSDASNLVAGDTNGVWDIFVHDRQTGQTARVSVDSGGGQANGISRGASISADGRYVTFYSDAANLVAGDTNAAWDAFAAPNPLAP